MANLIQVKRSTTNATPASLAAGELAYSFLNTSNSLFVGNTSAGGPIRIGGGNYVFLHQANTGTPGALTANAVVITNGNSFVSAWKTNNLIVGTDGTTINVSSISTTGNSTQLGASGGGSNTELVTSWAIKAYVDGKSAAASIVATNNQILYGNNNTYGQTSGFTFDYTTNLLSIGNTSVNTQISQTAITTTGTVAAGNTTLTGFVNVSSYGTFGGVVNASAINTTGAVTSTFANNVTITGTANVSTGVNVGANVVVTTSSISVGNSSVNTQIAAGNVFLNGSTLIVGNTATNTTITGTNATFGGTVSILGTVGVGNTTVTGFVNASSYGSFGGTVNATSFNSTGTATSTFANNVTISGVANTSSLNVSGVVTSGNTTTTGFINVSSYGTFGGTVNANALNVTGAATSTFANNLTVSGTINATSFNVSGTTTFANNTTVTGFINATSYGTFGGAVNATSFNTSGTLTAGNTTVTGFVNVSSYGTFGGTVNAAALNVSGVVTSGNTTTTGFINVSSYGTFGGTVNANALNVTGAVTSTFANSVTISGTTNTVSLNVTGDATIGGNLYVTGNLVSINVSTLAITDSLIQLATNNNVTPDVLDIGLFGNYGIDANTDNHRHTGLFRDASDSTWKLFDNLLATPSTTVDTSNTTFRFATLQAHVSTGGSGATGLVANATTIAITANSSLNVAIVANTLTLSTALSGTSGGTGLAAYTAEDLLVANSSNGFRKLNVGTDGYVLQVASGVVSWNTLDGGSF